jgi:hypothetical protein
MLHREMDETSTATDKSVNTSGGKKEKDKEDEN